MRSSPRAAWWVLCLAALLCNGPTTISRGAQQSDTLVTIRSREHPELIPDWYRWDQTFKLLPALKSPKIEAEDIGIPSADFTQLQAAASRYAENQSKLRERFVEVRDESKRKGEPVARAIAKTEQLEVQERFNTLRLADDLAEKMSPEAYAAILKWINGSVFQNATITVRDLKSFRYPR
jgi:hypothetical protein